MTKHVSMLTLAEAGLAGLLASAGAVLALGWVLGNRHYVRGMNERPPDMGAVPSWQRHQASPGR